jgi:hypothetical protein
MNLAGHRSVGGMRASLYNATSIEAVTALTEFMREFARRTAEAGSSMGYRILTLNNISVRGLERLPRERYELASEIGNPHAVLLRSADMHGMNIAGLGAGGGARRRRHQQHSGGGAEQARGAGIQRAGANANAVKELVLAGPVPGGAQHLPGLGLRARAAGR